MRQTGVARQQQPVPIDRQPHERGIIGALPVEGVIPHCPKLLGQSAKKRISRERSHIDL
jgi:hypothetical protein